MMSAMKIVSPDKEGLADKFLSIITDEERRHPEAKLSVDVEVDGTIFRLVFAVTLHSFMPKKEKGCYRA